MTYRLYVPNDFDQLYAIEEVCFPPSQRFGRRYMRSIIENHNSATWIAERDGRMTGFAIVDWATEDGEATAYIETIEVLPAERRSGAGSELMDRLESSARAANAESIWLHVDSRNQAAVKLYEAFGYTVQGREEGYYGSGSAALVYAKLLAAAMPS